ncbi:hypothetical protein NDN08_005698 [Rhodosorus marinus]|uniref:phosphoribosylanthranilate isomerase n=1 Tax=Rhodosorus marinus TaxID=101924 RepID=A0AAV8V2R6_9RHOD|nr:hypothetical protein NDN08_005698 [Rhodosorus marinus]
MTIAFLTPVVLKSKVSPRARRHLTMSSSRGGVNTVKICGMHTPEDARMVVEEARNLLPEDVSLMLGMIMWPGSKRYVSTDVASKIACIAKDAGIPSVGVFVDEDANTMIAARDAAGLDFVQLHGKASRDQYDGLPPETPKLYVVDVKSNGEYTIDRPLSEKDLVLFDSKGGDNITTALTSLDPWGVDVASGVNDEGGIRKDRAKLQRFLSHISKFYDLTAN